MTGTNLIIFQCKLISQAILQSKTQQKQQSRGALKKRCYENRQQIYRRTPMSECDFNKVALQLEIALRHGCSPVNMLYIFRTPFPKITSGRLLLIQLLWHNPRHKMQSIQQAIPFLPEKLSSKSNEY